MSKPMQTTAALTNIPSMIRLNGVLVSMPFLFISPISLHVCQEAYIKPWRLR